MTRTTLANQLREANQIISRQAELITRQQRALINLTHQLHAAEQRLTKQPDQPTFPARALRFGSPHA